MQRGKAAIIAEKEMMDSNTKEDCLDGHGRQELEFGGNLAF